MCIADTNRSLIIFMYLCTVSLCVIMHVCTYVPVGAVNDSGQFMCLNIHSVGSNDFHCISICPTAFDTCLHASTYVLLPGPQDIIQHNQKIILGLIWHLILRYQIFGGQTTTEEGESEKKLHKKPPAKKVLLKWLQSEMPPSLPVTNLSSDWNDGKHLSALVDSMKPGLIPDYESQVPSDALRNTQNAMDIAEEKFGIPKVIKPEHLCVEQPDELSVMTYLSYFCSGYDSPGHSSLLAWVREKIPEYNIQNFTTDWTDGKALSALVDALANGSMPHHAELDAEKGDENVRNAMKAAEENLDGISTSVSPEDFGRDSLTMMGYIGSFRKATLKRSVTETSPSKADHCFLYKLRTMIAILTSHATVKN